MASRSVVLLVACIALVGCGVGGNIDPSAVGQLFATRAPGEGPVNAPATLTGDFELATDYRDDAGVDELTETTSWKVDVRLHATTAGPIVTYADDGSSWVFTGHFMDVQTEPCRNTLSESTYDANGDFKDSAEWHRYLSARTLVHSDNTLYLILDALVQDIPGDGIEGGFCDEPPEETQPTTSVSLGCKMDQAADGSFDLTFKACLEGATGAQWSTISGHLTGQ
jgi:hypothetical protein